MIFGGNGYGKTTVCAILRSAQGGEPSHVIGRKTLGASAAPEVDLLFTFGNRRFTNGAWSASTPQISIFDGVFVADNVHSGDVVDVTHRRNLYRVIIGQTGVTLAVEEQRLAELGRAKQAELTAAGNALQAVTPQGFTLSQFIALAQDVDVDKHIGLQAQVTEALRQAESIRVTRPLDTLPEPQLDWDRLTRLLAATLEGVGAEIEAEINAHLARHNIVDNREWVVEGVAIATGDECPFCGRDGISTLSLIQAYRTLFGEAFRSLQANIRAVVDADIETTCGAAPRARLGALRANNEMAIEFWMRYCPVKRESFPSLESVESLLAVMAVSLRNVFETKASMLLEPIDGSVPIATATHDLSIVAAEIRAYNIAVVAANALISEKKSAAAGGNLDEANRELQRLQAVKHRYEQGAVDACDLYQRAEAEKKEIDRQKAAVRKQLEEHGNTVVEPYEQRINHFLQRFNAGFRIVKTGHGYPGGVATSTYQLLINDRNVDVGDSRTPLERASFKNTLSAGDRSTLSLSFFLASLEREPDLAERIVVFDDPFSSQDSFRRSNTIHEILAISNHCAQTIVFSHDAQFLKQLWEHAPAAERSALQIAHHRDTGSKLREFDIEDACRGRAALDQDELLAYRATGAGNPRDIIKKLRIVLETHFRSTYTGWFGSDDNLGVLLNKIRTGGDQHPAYHSYQELDRINDYTANYHHGEDPGALAEPPLDDTELLGFVEDTLRLVNALTA